MEFKKSEACWRGRDGFVDWPQSDAHGVTSQLYFVLSHSPALHSKPRPTLRSILRGRISQSDAVNLLDDRLTAR